MYVLNNRVMDANINIDELVTVNYLYERGFRFDETAPENVHRMKHNRMCDHHISITFEVNAELGFYVATYGFFHRNDEYNRITRKYHFKDMVLTVVEFETIMLDVYGNPRNVKDVLRHNNIKD
jgi:hypothetical protein